MAKGYVYVLKNPAHRENHFKIGMTTRTVAERITELSSGSGVPKPYEEVHSMWFEDCAIVEKQMHQLLTIYRQGNDREFFVVELWLVVKEISALKIKELEEKNKIFEVKEKKQEPEDKNSFELKIKELQDKNKLLEEKLREKTQELEKRERLSTVADLEKELYLFPKGEEREKILILIQDLKNKNKQIILLENLSDWKLSAKTTLQHIQDLKNDTLLNDKVKKITVRIIKIKQAQLTEQLKKLDF